MNPFDKTLESKRRSAAAHLLPRLRNALGESWRTCFRDHAARYTPPGPPLSNTPIDPVDDAWEMAESLLRHPDPRVACAAHDDLVVLRLRFERDRRAGTATERIRERRGPLVALMRIPTRLLVVRMPGPGARVWYLPV